MCRKIGQLRDGVRNKGYDEVILCAFDVGESRVVDDEAKKEARKHPIVAGVAEDINEWHCVGGEPVDKERLQFTFEKVCDDHA